MKRKIRKTAAIVLTMAMAMVTVLSVAPAYRAAAAADPDSLDAPGAFDSFDGGAYSLKNHVKSLEKIIELNVKRADKIPILLYHHLAKDNEMTAAQRQNESVMSVEHFTAQMTYLFENNYYTASLSELELYLNGKMLLPERTVVITFDDGYRSNTKYAYPLLKKYDFKAAVFLITGLIGEKENVIEHAGWNDLKKCGDVFSYHSHSHNLHKLIKDGRSSFQTSESSVVTDDLLISKGLLSTSYLAYPYGQTSRAGKAALVDAGYRLAFTTVAAYARRNSDKYEIPRFSISPKTDINAFEAICTGKAEPATEASPAQDAA